MKHQPYKVLITGITGFVGQNLATYLQGLEYQITGVSRTKNAGTQKGITHHLAWDSLTVSDLDRVDTVIHLAGKAHDLKNSADPEEYFAVNTGLTQKLFDLFLQSNANDFIYFSSVKAVADTVAGMLEETILPNPQTPYGQSKLQAEQYLLSKQLPAGKRVIILRPCMIHGPGNKGNLNLLFQFVQKGIPYPLAAFHNQRSFLSVDNLCIIVEKLICSPLVPSGIYQVADDKCLSTNQVVSIISAVLKRKPRLMKIPKGLLKTLAILGDKIKLPFNSERLKKLTESYRVSNQKIKAALNFTQLPLSAENGLKKTIESFVHE